MRVLLFCTVTVIMDRFPSDAKSQEGGRHGEREGEMETLQYGHQSYKKRGKETLRLYFLKKIISDIFIYLSSVTVRKGEKKVSQYGHLSYWKGEMGQEGRETLQFLATGHTPHLRVLYREGGRENIASFNIRHVILD